MAQKGHRRLFTGLTAAAVITACSLAAIPGGAAQANAAQQQPSTKVWTNEDIAALKNGPLSHPAGPSPNRAKAPQAAAARSGSKALLPREQDPGWYRVQVAHLRADAAQAQAKADEIQAELDRHQGGHRGNNLLDEPAGLTPQIQIQMLRKQAAEDRKKIEALEDMARSNGIPVREILYEPTLEDYAIYQALTAPPLPEPQGPPRTEEQWRARFTELRRELAAAIEERDVLQREFGVAELQYYPNPNTTLKEGITFHRENELRAKMEAQDAKIKALRQQISDLEDALRHAGGEPGWARSRD
ncbi:MAG TPA: hypothetical protein VLW54_08780 [Candidatus Acidoferrales bacterium]|nr:hypothetical protein [Candidatus Acidoferrales bacterium]